MPCSSSGGGVSLDYRETGKNSSNSTMSAATTLSSARTSHLNYRSVGSSEFSRRPSASISQIAQKYYSRSGLSVRSSSLSEDLKDGHQGRTAGSSSSSLSRTAVGTSGSTSSSSSLLRKQAGGFDTFDLAEFRTTYAPTSYIAGTYRASSNLRASSLAPSSSTSSATAGGSSALTSGYTKDRKSLGKLEVIGDVMNKTKKDGGDSHLGQVLNGGDKSAVSPSSAAAEVKSTNPPTSGSGCLIKPTAPPITSSLTSSSDGTTSAGDLASDSTNISPRQIRNGTSIRKDSISNGSNSTNTNGLSGLRNIGNTCFLNSVVQCLSNTKQLKEFLVSREYLSELKNSTSETRGALIKSFADVITELWSGEGRVVNTSAFKEKIQRYAPRFMGYNQQDAQEFLRYLLEGIHDDINRVTIKPRNLPEIDDNLSDGAKATESWKQYLRFDNSRIVELFVGQLKSTLTCTVCSHQSTTFEVFWDLSLPLPSASAVSRHSSVAGSGSLRLQQCLDHFTKEEVLDGNEMPTCSKCKTRRKCTKRFSIQKFPKILVLHLKRFSPSERYRKLSANVEFPLTNLDMSDYSASSAHQSQTTYNLYAVSNHSGTAYSGHYTAYCLHSGTNSWYEFNDSRVSTISSRNIVSSEAYILFYELQQPHQYQDSSIMSRL